MDSTQIAFVLSSIAFSNNSGDCESTNFTFLPKSFKVFSNNSNVPPYKLSADTILSPTCVRLIIAQNIPANPLAVAYAALPPSIAAILFSNASVVGFVNLEYIFPPSCRANLFAAWSVSLNTYDVV